MKHIFLLLASLFALPAVADTLNILVFGDSLSAGYKLGKGESFASQLEKALIRKNYPVKVLNHSVSGATSADGVKRIKSALAQKPNAVILQLGANDMLQNLDLTKTKENLQTIITRLSKKNIPILLAGMEASLTMPPEYRNNFRQMYVDLASNNDLLLYPFFMQGLWNEDGIPVAEDYFLPDHMHPTAKGVSVMVDNILPVVEQFIFEDISVTPKGK